MAAESDTETLASVRLELDSWRWPGVPWIIRAGKGLASTVTEAVVEFRWPPRQLFTDSKHRPAGNRLTFRTKTEEEITVSYQAKTSRPDMISSPVELHLQHDRVHGSDACGRLPGNALRGTPVS